MKRTFFAKVSDLTGGAVSFGEGFAAERVMLTESVSIERGNPEQLVELADKLEHPLWWVVDEASGNVDAVRVPVRSKVAEIVESDGNYEVLLFPSQLPRKIARGERLDSILGALRRAKESGATLLISETDDHEILDVTETHEEIGFPFESAAEMLLETREAVEVAPAAVNDLFKLVAARDCGPKPAGSTCIPFMYPDDGCWGRAHEMCRLIGAAAGKAWVYGSLRVSTRNNPRCSVSWGYHVAPQIKVAGKQDHVIDPSMFSSAVPLSQWLAAQGGAASNHHRTDASVFYRSADGKTVLADPNYQETARVLSTYRLKLLERAGGASGPPPYNCP